MAGSSLGTNVSKIKDLPTYERPREKAKQFGIESLSNEELIALLLGTGTKNLSVMEVAHNLLSDNHGLSNLFRKPYQALLDVKGIGPGKALVLSATFELSKRYLTTNSGDEIIENSEQIYHRYISRLKDLNNEVVMLVILNRRKRIIYEEIIFKGGEDRVGCSSGEIVKKVLIHGGKSFYLIHNHPSEIIEPSDFDRILTGNIEIEAKTLNINFVDHLIVSQNGFYSFFNELK